MSEVIQADREAFAAMCDIQGGPNVMPSYVRMGQADDHPGVQAFAAHRLAHLTPNTDLSDERAREVLAKLIYAADGADIEPDEYIPSPIVLRAMHQYAAGLQGEVERLRRELEPFAAADRRQEELAAQMGYKD